MKHPFASTLRKFFFFSVLMALFVTGLGIPLLFMRTVNNSPARKYYKILFG